jgi:hypothetical protein
VSGEGAPEPSLHNILHRVLHISWCFVAQCGACCSIPPMKIRHLLLKIALLAQ